MVVHEVKDFVIVVQKHLAFTKLLKVNIIYCAKPSLERFDLVQVFAKHLGFCWGRFLVDGTEVALEE
jgi:hypothetical protein